MYILYNCVRKARVSAYMPPKGIKEKAKYCLYNFAIKCLNAYLFCLIAKGYNKGNGIAIFIDINFAFVKFDDFLSNR